jgi:NADH-quinone oxidoreductase subunit L
LFGFASTFLIGAYNDRPTVRNNATYAFAAYQISDMALLAAVAFSQPHVSWYYLGIESEYTLVAACLMFAALFKSSQLPLTSLFVRSMEGPTPASALGYAVTKYYLFFVLFDVVCLELIVDDCLVV